MSLRHYLFGNDGRVPAVSWLLMRPASSHSSSSDFNANFAIFVILIWWLLLLLFVYCRDRNVVKFKVIFLLNGSMLCFPHLIPHEETVSFCAALCWLLLWLRYYQLISFLWVYCVTISVLNWLLSGISHEAIIDFYVQNTAILVAMTNGNFWNT